MKVTPRRLFAAVELTLAALIAAIALFALLRGLSYNKWERDQGFGASEFLAAWWLFMTAAAFPGASRYLRLMSPPSRLLHTVQLAVALWLLYSFLKWPRAPTGVVVCLFSVTLVLSAAAVMLLSELIARNWTRAWKLLGTVLAGSTALALTVRLLASDRARFTADTLLMINDRAYRAESLHALLSPLAVAPPFGLVLGGLVVWSKRRSPHERRPASR